MKKLRVYVDTSVVGGCFDPEFAAWSNALVADFNAERLLPVVSELVAAEVQVAPPQVQAKFVSRVLRRHVQSMPGCAGELELQTHSPAREDSAVLGG